MEVFIEFPAYIRSKTQDQPRENVHSKIWQSDTTTYFLDRGELVCVFSISDKRNLNILWRIDKFSPRDYEDLRFEINYTMQMNIW